MLSTEIPDRQHPELDLYDTPRLVQAFTADQLEAARVVHAAAADLARAVEAAVPRIAAGGRLIYAGAGSSGRLGVLDSVELYPTFRWPKDRALALVAGGRPAVFEAVEGAEDDRARGGEDLRALQPTPNDVCIALAASGTTPYTLGVVEAARTAGALTIGLANNPGAPLTAAAEIGITLATGSEVISGSTRLKAGTAQKIALNAISSSIMVRLHKVHGNLMVDLVPTNLKLLRRSVALTMRATGADENAARRALEACGHRVKVAIVALKVGCGPAAALAALETAGGSVRRAIALAHPEGGG